MELEPKTRFTPTIPASLHCSVLQRKCACGQHNIAGGRCAACRGEREPSLQCAQASPDTVNTVPHSVHEVLCSPGQPLDAETRSFMEPRFGHDFSQVRIHADAKAGESASAVDALAYTVRNDIVFGAHQHTPNSSVGRELLAHELAHVIQQKNAGAGAPTRVSQPSDSGEADAEHLSRSALSGERDSGQPAELPSPVLSRRVIPRSVHCTGGSDGAPADPVTALTAIVDGAENMARTAANLLRLDAVMTRFGVRPTDSDFDQDFVGRFGEPPAVNGGFMNRFTGAVRPTLDVAVIEEMVLTAGRYETIANQFGRGSIHYLCMSTEKSFGGCNITNCSRNAWACPNVNAMFLCPGFWGGDPRTSSALLIHEAAHMVWERVDHGARGSGGNFRNAECYASLVSDIEGLMPAENPECFIPASTM